MLGYRDAGSPRHESRRRRDVQGALGVAAGAAGVHHTFGSLDVLGKSAHGAGETDYFAYRLAPDAESRKERRRRRGRHGPLHDVLQRPLRLFGRERLPGRSLLQRLLEHDYSPGSGVPEPGLSEPRKFFRIFMPLPVSTLSG